MSFKVMEICPKSKLQTLLSLCQCSLISPAGRQKYSKMLNQRISNNTQYFMIRGDVIITNKMLVTIHILQ